MSRPEYLEERTDLYKANHITALKNVYGEKANDVIEKIESMDNKTYRRLLQSDEDMEINFIYDPSVSDAKLNQIRLILGLDILE